jgi:UDP-GlcNAc:undecaprenyl-phosphate/decaprenyl-phosphate GlcNAc-1-phosphate transferase
LRIPYSLILAFSSAVVTLLLTPLVMRLSRRLGALDVPGPRRIHREPVPTLGGLAMVIAAFAVAWTMRLLPGPAEVLEMRAFVGLSLAAVPILLLGLVDDLRGASAWAKLGVQTSAALVLYHYGFAVPVITNPFGGPIETGFMSLPLTVAWVLIVMNAINLIDGLDGLASGVVLIASIAQWWVGREHLNFYVMFWSSILIGVTFGFLRFNFPPARIFMGDTGSQFLGLLLAGVSLLDNRKGTVTVTLLFPLVAMAVPIADSVLAFLRRMVRRRPIFRADSEHIHHRLLRLGLSHRNAVFVLWFVAGYSGIMAVILATLPPGYALLMSGVLATGLFFAFEVLEFIDRKLGERRGSSGDEA